MTIWPKGSFAGIRYCSRPYPQNIGRYWSPRWRDIALVERLLPYSMREWRVATGNTSPANATRFEDTEWERRFSRNYFGLVRGGRKVLYIDFAPSSLRDGFHICDGGSAFFGVEVDPESMAIIAIEENGVG